MDSQTEGPLVGARVLDLSRYVPGPFCSQLLVSLGAEVIKVEAPEVGDPMRSLDREAFERLNRKKKSLTLNLKTVAGRRLLLELAEGADALIEGFRPGVMERLELDYARVRPRNPAIVYVSITGYGQGGPYRDRAGHDINYMAVAGALGKEVPRVQVADFAGGGLFGALALVSAFLQREKTGQGAYIDLAMVDGVTSMLSLATSEAGSILSGRYPGYTLYHTRDEKLMSVGALEPVFWQRFCRAIGRPELSSRDRDPSARDEIAQVIRSRDLPDWEERFSQTDACVESVRGPSEARAHPQVAHRLSQARRPTSEMPEPAPGLGEHTESVLGELGVSAAEIESLRAKGAC